MDIGRAGREYTRNSANATLGGPDPMELFEKWLGEAMQEEKEAHAMTLCTCSPEGTPTGRMVLLKEIDRKKAHFVFYTHRNSPKAQDIQHTTKVGLVFFWRTLERQVRVQGEAHPVAPAKAEAYFATRPRGSQLSAWLGEQSRPVASHSSLRARYKQLEAIHPHGTKIPPPPHWGGYAVEAKSIEFWVGKLHRLHERVLYSRRPQKGVRGEWRQQILIP